MTISYMSSVEIQILEVVRHVKEGFLLKQKVNQMEPLKNQQSKNMLEVDIIISYIAYRRYSIHNIALCTCIQG